MTIQNKILLNKIAGKLLKTLLFYFIASVIIYYSEQEMPSGPCAPGLGMIAFFVLIPISFVLFLVSLYKGMEKDRSYFASSLVHVLYFTGIYYWQGF